MHASHLGRAWEPRLAELYRLVRAAVREASRRATSPGGSGPGELARVLGQGVGDETFVLDGIGERVVLEWARRAARSAPLSLLTEDAGWRHFGPAPGGTEVRELEGFDHGGPRVVCDPIDGTRNLMHDLRSAWCVLALAGPGTRPPRLSELELALVGELCDSRAARARLLRAVRGGGARLLIERLDDSPDGRPEGASEEREVALRADADARVDRGYFPFFAFHPTSRARVARLAADFFARVERAHGADLASCLDDQYIASAAHLALTALGTYRMVVDLRAGLPELGGAPTQTAKPYDVAGAVLVAREAGAEVLDLAGRPLELSLDASTPVAYCAFANEATRARLWPLLAETLAAARRGEL